MRIAVVGAGSVGGYLGARLAAAGAEVRLVARGAHLAAIRAHGLAVRSPLGDVHVDVPATDDAAEIGACDVVLVGVKAYDLEDAAAAHLPHLVGPGSVVVPLQNGVDSAERLAAVVGRDQVIGGLAIIFAGIVEPGVVAHTGGPAKLVFGELDGTLSERVRRLEQWCAAAGIDAEASDDIRLALWHKYAFICAVAGTTAAVRLPLGEIRAAQASWALFRRLLEETYAVAAAADGVAVPAGAVEERLAFAERLEAESYSSLHDDLVAGRRMELDALHGALVRRAGELGVPVPAAAAVHGVLEPWARRNARANS